MASTSSGFEYSVYILYPGKITISVIIENHCSLLFKVTRARISVRIININYFLMFINLLTISSTNLSSFELSSDIVDMARLNEVKFMRLVLVKGHCMHQPLTAIIILHQYSQGVRLLAERQMHINFLQAIQCQHRL